MIPRDSHRSIVFSHRYRLQQWNGFVICLRIRDRLYFLVLACIRNGPCLGCSSSGIFSLRERPLPLSFRRFLASDLRQDGELYLEVPVTTTCSWTFHSDTWSFQKNPSCLLYTYFSSKKSFESLGNCQDENSQIWTRFLSLQTAPNPRPFDAMLQLWTLPIMTKGRQHRVGTVLAFDDRRLNGKVEIMNANSCLRHVLLQIVPSDIS